MRRALLIPLLLVLCLLPEYVFAQTFVASKNSTKYHYQSCEWAQKISPANKIEFRSVDEAYAAGYIPCSVCKPPGRESGSADQPATTKKGQPSGSEKTALRGNKTDTMVTRPTDTGSRKPSAATAPSKKAETPEREKTAIRGAAVDTTSARTAEAAVRKTTPIRKASPPKKPPTSAEEKTALRKVMEETAQPSASAKAQPLGQPAAESMPPRMDTILTRFTGTTLLRPRHAVIPQPSQGPFSILADSLHFAAPDYRSASDSIMFDRWTSKIGRAHV